ncbi:thymopoietin isoform X1 [Trichosurus vulpecula]|uniref:thymopoietin isoform X1 n=1 Tax=Trichosurus vulpecula TaxID=9337 RepID=UPI00186AF561|nr:thymopoietin isoform X1 [Trichosurus vulpecula]
MPEFLEDPSVLTKDRLKSELLANNVTLPAGEQRKDVYVQLYLQHLTARNRPSPGPAQPPPPAPAANSRAPPDFSSDDEREPTPVLSVAGRGRGGAAAGRKATKKTDKPRSEEKDDLDVTELTNEELLSQLVKYGVNPGPIVGTTRKLYEKKLLKLREHGPESRSSTPLPAVSSSAENARQNGNDDSDRYSDNEEGKKKEHKKVKSTRESVRISELPTSPSGGFFQAVSFPEIRARPPLGWTELQAAKRGHSSNRDPFREPLSTSSSLGIGQAEKVVSGEDLFSSPKYGQDRFLGKSSLSSSQAEPFATLASAAARPSCSPSLNPTPKYPRDHLENICGGNKYEFGSSFTERAYSLAQSVLSQNREKPDILENSQVITPPLAQAIRDYVNSLLIKAGASNLPGISNPTSANVENPDKEVGLSQFQETESRCSPPKFPRLHESSAKERDSGSLHASQDNVALPALAKAVISQSLSTLGIETPKERQHDTLISPEPSFPLHESILKVIDEEWSHIDKEIPPMASKYPVSSRETSCVLSVPKVDDEILELTSEVTSPASARACNKQLDFALCRTYEAAAGALQIAAHTAFVARAIQTDIGQVAQILSSDPSQIPEALRTLSRTYDAASFLCDAAFDEVRMAACGMGSSTVGRRHLWLNNDKVSPTHRNKLSVLPLKGGTLFGGEVQKVIKKRGKRQ